MKTFESLFGVDLDKYGESIGIPRYQGLMGPESDESYKNMIRKETYKNVPKDDFHSKTFHNGEVLYGVVAVEIASGKVTFICDVLDSNPGVTACKALYWSESEASDMLKKWRDRGVIAGFEYQIREVGVFCK